MAESWREDSSDLEIVHHERQLCRRCQIDRRLDSRHNEDMATGDLEEAQRTFADLIERAHASEEVIIVKKGQPYARLSAVDGPRRIPGLLTGEVGAAFFDPLPPEELSVWER
jgi:prevent-host-death family protein